MLILFQNYFQRKIRIPTSFHVKRTAYNRKEPKETHERHRNIREKFRKLGLYSKQNFKSETKKSVKSIPLSHKMKVTICQRKNILKSKQWQKFNRQPWELVEQIWKETSANRILVIHQKDEKYHKQYFV
ncbi:hypothetical protein Avbf_17597 [Armadillidium vulgare]|nr:hypothetical protein Avbf_17597 [Armadillidium vulgare]